MWSNFHMHSKYCDGKGELMDYVEKAMVLKMVSLGFSSHAPVNFPCKWCMQTEDLGNYLEEVDNLKTNVAGLEIYKSLEIDFIPGRISPDQFKNQLDYTIGSVHFVDEWPDRRPWEIDGQHTLFLKSPLLLFLLLLDKLPPPSNADEALRTRRKPMDAPERKKFVRMFWPGIVLFTFAYMLLTPFRDFRDNFSAEVWNTLGYGNSPEIFTTTEIPVSIAVLVVMGSLMLIKNNKLAQMINHLIIFIGMILIGVSTLLFEQQLVSPPVWMIMIGLGLYLGYVPFNSIFFDRLLAAFKYVGTVGFVMYVADSFGYLGSVSVLFFKEFGYADLSWLDFFISSGYIVSTVGSVLIACSMAYFHFKHRQWKAIPSNASQRPPLTE
jgi:Family of unknown function (DUF5690)/PHP domain